MDYEIDLSGIYGADEFHDVLGEAVPLPEYYGRNLDALCDVIREFGTDWHLHFTHCDDAEVTMSKFMIRLRRMCDALASELPEFEATFE